MRKSINAMFVLLAFAWSGTASAIIIHYDLEFTAPTGTQDISCEGNVNLCISMPTEADFDLLAGSFDYDFETGNFTNVSLLTSLNRSYDNLSGDLTGATAANELGCTSALCLYQTATFSFSPLQVDINSAFTLVEGGRYGDGGFSAPGFEPYVILPSAYGLAVPSAPPPDQVPISATVPLIALGLAALGFSRRRKSNS